MNEEGLTPGSDEELMLEMPNVSFSLNDGNLTFV